MKCVEFVLVECSGLNSGSNWPMVSRETASYEPGSIRPMVAGQVPSDRLRDAQVNSWHFEGVC